ncbi:enoyl-CoA hydratase-related protein [Pseudorhodobacter aquimaris]|uniref:enoyl-CoA hydratase-related protein n=1 Tax=Pseudorhodobacter aquimaris TaxID=687412 RepID=UPI00067DCA94|nr:enoyl-CoA hydratase-related protein [Pseudorhodobacter aquimaris]
MQSDTPSLVTLEQRGAVLVLWIDNPPVNALGAGVRAGLADGLANAADNPEIHAVALLARGRMFSAGAEISEFGRPSDAPLLTDLCNRIESSPKPVVAGIHGRALGGGLELALAAHARVALADAQIGLPEVKLGILPGAGGTQRLPRLIEPDQALSMMISGSPVAAPEALAMGLLDKVVEKDLEAATITYALHMAGNGPVVPTRDRRDGFRDGKRFFAAIAAARRTQETAPLPGPGRIIDCVEAANLLPFEQGLAFERAAFSELVATPESQALRHTFFAERRAAHMEGARAKPQTLGHIAVLGSRNDAVALIMELLFAGYDVTMVDHDTQSLSEGLEAVALILAAEVKAGQMAQAEHDAQWARLYPALSGSDDGEAADMLFLTGPYRARGAEVPAVPIKGGAPIVTLGHLGAGGAQALGLILMPASRNGHLAEMLIAPNTQPEAIATLLHLLRKLGRPVVQGQNSGVNAGLVLALQSSLKTLEAQHGPEPVRDLLGRWGMMRDNKGHLPPPLGPINLWSGLAAPVMGALANAGLRMIGEGTALRPSDIDLAFILGHGFPRWGGGPMLWAGRRGLMVLRDDLNHWAGDAPDIWSPAPLLDDLIRQGISLGDLNDA